MTDRPDPSELCLRCGMCCDGTLFSFVELSEDEAHRLRGLRLPVLQRDEGPALVQPCAALEGDDRCSVYSQRPGGCRRFTCLVHDQYTRGELDYQKGLAKIDRARHLAASIRARVAGRPIGFDEVSALLSASDDETVAWRRRHAELLLDLVSFTRLCERDFGSRRPPAARSG